MVVYLHEALQRRLAEGRPLNALDIEQATIDGAVQRLRPKLMTVTAVIEPHDQDEIYVIAAGTGLFLQGENETTFAPGDVLFVPAGEEHRFTKFTDDFAAWVFLYGPRGGEPAAGPDVMEEDGH